MDITLESYIKTLNEIEMKVFKIASSHLESSFSLEKSIFEGIDLAKIKSRSIYPVLISAKEEVEKKSRKILTKYN